MERQSPHIRLCRQPAHVVHSETIFAATKSSPGFKAINCVCVCVRFCFFYLNLNLARIRPPSHPHTPRFTHPQSYAAPCCVRTTFLSIGQGYFVLRSRSVTHPHCTKQHDSAPQEAPQSGGRPRELRKFTQPRSARMASRRCALRPPHDIERSEHPKHQAKEIQVTTCSEQR